MAGGQHLKGGEPRSTAYLDWVGGGGGGRGRVRLERGEELPFPNHRWRAAVEGRSRDGNAGGGVVGGGETLAGRGTHACKGGLESRLESNLVAYGWSS